MTSAPNFINSQLHDEQINARRNDNESFRLSGFSLSLPGFESIIPGAKKNLAADLVHAPVKPIPGKKQSLLRGLGEWLYHTVLSKSIVTKLTLVSNWRGASPLNV